MSSGGPTDLYPIVVVEDRYQGVYSQGRWWAVANADMPLEGATRIAWLMENGPSRDDVTAAVFWGHAPPWIGVGVTADTAIARLTEQAGADGDDWSPSPLEGPLSPTATNGSIAKTSGQRATVLPRRERLADPRRRC